MLLAIFVVLRTTSVLMDFNSVKSIISLLKTTSGNNLNSPLLQYRITIRLQRGTGNIGKLAQLSTLYKRQATPSVIM